MRSFTSADRPTIDDAKMLIRRLQPSDRAALRPWLIAAYDVGGDEQQAYVSVKLNVDDDVHRLRTGR